MGRGGGGGGCLNECDRQIDIHEDGERRVKRAEYKRTDQAIYF